MCIFYVPTHLSIAPTLFVIEHLNLTFSKNLKVYYSENLL